MPTFSNPLFTLTVPKKSSYLFNQTDFKCGFDDKQSLTLPLNHDSEWNSNALVEFLSSSIISPRAYLSTQIKHIFNKAYCFFTDFAINETGNNLLPMEHDFTVQDYLNQFGIATTLEYKDTDNKYPFLDIWLYSFFGIVDITLLAKPGTLIADCIKTGLANNQISHEKRLTTKWNKPVTLPVIINLADIEGVYHPYHLRLTFIDIGALHGNANYKTVCNNVGINTSAKSLMDKYKSDMLLGLKLHPREYIEYALGDLNVYDVLVAYDDLMKHLYQDLELSDYYQSPKLTIGATVADIVSAVIFKWQGISPDVYYVPKERKKVLIDLMGMASADYLRTQLVKSHKYLLGKIHGGRCRNNNPIMRCCEDAIADYDIAGAYSSIMRQIPLFVGNPWFFDSTIQGEKTLKEFLRCHESDLDDWHYVIYVSTAESLEYEQDFLVSWIGAKTSKVKIKDAEGNITYAPLADYKSGECRIYRKDVVNTPITSDTVKWIKSLSKRVRDDLMDKLIVKSAMGYKRKDKDSEWKSINFGDLLINTLTSKRAYYKNAHLKTGDSHDNSLQELFKLVINTSYGVMCSRHFVTSNVVVANNITQAVRLGVYLMEKGLNLQGSITDGCMGSLNKVVYPRGKYIIKCDKLNSLYLENTHTLNQKNLRLGVLDNAEHIALTWRDTQMLWDDEDSETLKLPILTIDYGDRIVTIKDEIEVTVKNEKIKKIRHNHVNAWINEKSWQHLNNLFPDFAYLFSFLKIETKNVYDSYVYHGAANYELKNPNPKEIKYAMRGYSKKTGQYEAIENSENGLIQLDDYAESSVPKVFLSQLHNNELKKLPAFIKTKILKSKDFRLGNYLERSELQCGDNIIEVGLPNYCSLSQYTYLTIEQHDKWVWAASRLKRKYQETFEIFFTNKNGLLNYDLMVRELCTLVNSGCQTPINALAKKYHVKPTLETRAITKLNAAKLRNELTFTIKLNDNQAVELED